MSFTFKQQNYIYDECRGDRKVLRRCALEFCEDQAKQGALYSEVRFLSQLMISEKPQSEADPENDCITDEEVIQVLLDGFAEGSLRYGINVKSLLTCYRPLPGT